MSSLVDLLRRFICDACPNDIIRLHTWGLEVLIVGSCDFEGCELWRVGMSLDEANFPSAPGIWRF